MWNAKITKIEKDDKAEVAQITFEYVHTDGRKKEVIERVSDPNSIKSIAQNAVKELERIDAINALVANPTLGEISFASPQPTAEDLVKQAEAQKIEELRSLKEQVSLGLVTETEYQTKLTEVKSETITKR